MRLSILISSVIFFVNLPVLLGIPYINPDFNQKFNNLPEIISFELVDKGFENVMVKISKETIIVSYENRIYRNEPEAAYEVIVILLKLIDSDINIVIIPQFRKIPMLLIKTNLKTFKVLLNENKYDEISKSIDISLKTDLYWNEIDKMKEKNFSNYKLDIIIHPQFKAKFGKYGDPVESQINIAPELKTSLWKGLSISSQIIIPLQNKLDSTGDYIRPGLLTVNQLIRLPFNTFISGTAGCFTENRYGVDLDMKTFFYNGRLSLNIITGYTRFAFYQKGVWYYLRDNLFTSTISLCYRNPIYDLNIGVKYGKFMKEDKGWRFDISRQFGETEIGFYYSTTTFGSNGGFNFAIPLPLSKYWTIKSIRLRTPELFPWEYRYKYLDDNAKTYNTGNRIDNLIKKFNPDFFKKQLISIFRNEKVYFIKQKILSK